MSQTIFSVDCPSPSATLPLSFQNIVAESLKKLRSGSDERKASEVTIPGQFEFSPSKKTADHSPNTVGVRFHLRETNLDEIPVGLSSRTEGFDSHQESEVAFSKTVDAGIRFCWTRGNSVASEEFIRWSRTQGDIRGRLTGLSPSHLEFESDVKVPTGSRWHGRVMTEEGYETDLTGIVTSVERVSESCWRIECRITAKPSDPHWKCLIAD